MNWRVLEEERQRAGRPARHGAAHRRVQRCPRVAEKFNGTTDDVFEVQERMSRRIVEGTRGRSGRRKRVAHRCGPRRTPACTKLGCGRCTRADVRPGERRPGIPDREGSRGALRRARAAPCGVGLPDYVAYDMGIRYVATRSTRPRRTAGRRLRFIPSSPRRTSRWDWCTTSEATCWSSRGRCARR